MSRKKKRQVFKSFLFDFSLLHLEIEMNELNGNEIYYYLNQDLPTNSYQSHNIETGDIMLFGSSC